VFVEAALGLNSSDGNLTPDFSAFERHLEVALLNDAHGRFLQWIDEYATVSTARKRVLDEWSDPEDGVEDLRIENKRRVED
jgi:hypothetical protein